MQKVSARSRRTRRFRQQHSRKPSTRRGVCLHIPWNEVEKEPGKSDFGAVDNFVAVLRSIGMKYQLCFKPGASTPAFVYAEGAQPFETRVMNPHRANFGEAIVIPVPWDPDLSAKLFRVIAQLGEHVCERSLVRKRRA